MIPKKLELTMKNLLSASYPEGFGLEPKPRVTPYHQVFLSLSEEGKEKREEDVPSLSDGTLYCRLFPCVGEWVGRGTPKLQPPGHLSRGKKENCSGNSQRPEELGWPRVMQQDLW